MDEKNFQRNFNECLDHVRNRVAKWLDLNSTQYGKKLIDKKQFTYFQIKAAEILFTRGDIESNIGSEKPELLFQKLICLGKHLNRFEKEASLVLLRPLYNAQKKHEKSNTEQFTRKALLGLDVAIRRTLTACEKAAKLMLGDREALISEKIYNVELRMERIKDWLHSETQDYIIHQFEILVEELCAIEHLIQLES